VNLVGEKRIAAVFASPSPVHRGSRPAARLPRALREISTRYGILLVFDEVICGFAVPVSPLPRPHSV